jgi:hypothetical protein
MQNALQQAFMERNDKMKISDEDSLQTVETYFIMTHPLNIVDGFSETTSCFLGRQAHTGRSFSYPGTYGIYEDKFGRRQADAFGAAVDMGGVTMGANNFLSRLFNPVGRRLRRKFGGFFSSW